MSNETPHMNTASHRKPRSFDPEETVVEEPISHRDQDGLDDETDPTAHAGAHGDAQFQTPTIADLKRGFRWGALFFAAASALVGIALSLWFARLVSVALARDDWIGWMSLGLFGLMALALLAIALREILGLMRLRNITARRTQADEALRQGDKKAARSAVGALRKSFRGRRDMRWALDNHRQNAAGMHDAHETLTLADRDLLAPLDREARKVIAQSAKRVAVVTALSPAAVLDVFFVFVENVRMLRRLATLYGGRPGLTGGITFGKRVVGHLIVTGGMALTDDLLGQFVGQDLLRRLSRRMGEGVFNGALTARIGVAAAEMVRPLPWIETTPLKFREIAKEIAFRRAGATSTTGAD
ncbi:MAG: TIGR01620 family protein [Pseudomonadota bacterium]